MRILTPCVSLGFAILTLPLPASADPIALISLQRSISNSAGVQGAPGGTTNLFDNDVLGNTLGSNPDFPGSAFSDSLLISQTQPAEGNFTAHGSTTTARDGTGGAHAQLTYGITFDLTAAQDYVFGGTFGVGSQSATDRSSWAAQLFFFPRGPNPTTAFDFSGTIHSVCWRPGASNPDATDSLPAPSRIACSLARLAEPTRRSTSA
jgi:hypothetical protein